MRCIIIDDDSVSLRILAEYIARTDFLVDAGQFATSIEAINFLHTNPDIDLIFLDVRLPEMDGFEFLDTFENPPQVIMVSASEEYALKAFDFGAIDYLLKPVAYARFYKAVQRALKSMNPISAEGELFLKKNSSLVRVPYSSIFWVESMENYVNIFAERGRFTLHFTLKAVEGHLPHGVFRRIHRSYIVNTTKIESIEDNVVIMSYKGEAVRLPIGKSYRDVLLSSLRFSSPK